MGTEESSLNALSDGENEDIPAYTNWWDRKHKRLWGRNRGAIEEFLGEGTRTSAVGILPRFYCELFTWALHCYLKREEWTVVKTLGYHGPEPIYIDVNTGDASKNLLMDGQMFIERGDSRFMVTVDVNPRCRGSVQVEGMAERDEEIRTFVSGVITIAEDENFYRGKKVEFNGRIRILNVQDRSWESIIMDADTKSEIKANTVGFLKRIGQWSKYGIPTKRGILLAGEPGTGKTIICKALMAEVDGVTCITTNGYALADDDYISELYELAEDLSPSCIFIDDIDLIGQNRDEFGYQRGPALIQLLSALDGIEQKHDIVTIATTNCLETIDKALSERPQRFDRVIKLTRPQLEQRRELVNRLCQMIPLGEALQEYVSCKTEGCTPAQIQEVIYSLVIENPDDESPVATFTEHDMDLLIAKVAGRSKERLGFCTRTSAANFQQKFRIF